jgi:hypothetical protein
MNIYQTALTKNSPSPRQLDYLKAANRRNLLTTEKEKSLLFTLEKGAAGEQVVLDYIKRYGESHWTVIQNLWMDYRGTYETDLGLLTNHAFHNLEIKNYDGLFEYKNHRCYINGRKNKENPIFQAEKSFMNAQNLCREINPLLNVTGALIFIGEHNQVNIQSEVDDIQIVTRTGLRAFIQNIAANERNYPYPPIDSQQLITHFEKHEVLNPFNPSSSFRPKDLLDGRLGIYCKRCFCFDLKTTRKFVKCKCGFVELRRAAILRTIYEYGALTFDEQFMYRKDLQTFMDNQIGNKLLTQILNKHFEPIQKNKYTKYTNKKQFLFI